MWSCNAAIDTSDTGVALKHYNVMPSCQNIRYIASNSPVKLSRVTGSLVGGEERLETGDRALDPCEGTWAR